MGLVERFANLGYLAVSTEATKGTPVIPTFFLPAYEETLTTNANLQKQQPIMGKVFATAEVMRGLRDHQGEITTPADPNTSYHHYDMFMSRGTSSGAGPYTQEFVFSETVAPKSKTVDVYKGGSVVHRFWGVQASAINEEYDNNERILKSTVSALGSFTERTIASVSTNTIVLDTGYSATPNKGLVATDLVQIYKKSTGATLNTTVTTVNADGKTVVLGASAAAFAAGDIIQLRPATPSYNLLSTSEWARTHYFFADTVANAMSATQIRVEQGSAVELLYPFENDAGSPRSGDYDPAALPRLGGDGSVSVKEFFDTQERVQAWNDMSKSAIVVRHYSGSTNQYEERVSFYEVTTDTPTASLKSNSINYSTMNFIPSNNGTNDITVTIIHSMSSIA